MSIQSINWHICPDFVCPRHGFAAIYQVGGKAMSNYEKGCNYYGLRQ